MDEGSGAACFFDDVDVTFGLLKENRIPTFSRAQLQYHVPAFIHLQIMTSPAERYDTIVKFQRTLRALIWLHHRNDTIP